MRLKPNKDRREVMPEEAPWTLTARWVFPVEGPPLERGTVTIQGDKIAAVEPGGGRTADVDLGNTAILPGLVNAHTHLDLSGLRGKCPPTGDFTEWLREVIRHRRSQTPEQAVSDIQIGLLESQVYGTTLLGDISAAGASWPGLVDKPLRAAVFREILGLPADRARQAWMDMLRWSRELSPSTNCRWGLSPHAPYSVNAALIRAIAWNGHLMAIHLAESRAELDLIERHEGPFVGFLEELRVWSPDDLVPSVDWVLWRTRRASFALLIHGNYLQPSANIPPNATLVYCPRTHAAFGHPPHPFREFLARGVRVALGTDSLASNPDLDILAEARFVHGKYADVPGATLLRMITLSGAEALGWADDTGSLTPGKSADLVVLPLPDEERSDPHLLVLESALRVAKTLFRGAWRE
jgi:cytosine/adenosine deaminase-related metal-dependent hydrolase